MIHRQSLGVALATATLAISASVAAGGPPSASSPDQPGRDGCQRNAGGVIFLKTPEWVYVGRDAAVRSAQGVVRVSHVAKEDAPGEHDSHDYNANLQVDAASRYLLGGDPQSQTGNYAPGDPEESRRLHFEYESAAVPSFAWPSDGDHAKLWGSWIWDCGHWTDGGGQIVGERTEFHPLTAMVVTRKTPYLPRTTQSQTDVFISSDGTRARAVERCALALQPISPSEYGPDFRQCARDDASRRVQPVRGTYRFRVAAPPKPSRGARLFYRVMSRIRGASGTERVRRTAHGLRVAVTMPAKAPSYARPVRYGKSFFVGWTGLQRTRPTPLRVTLDTLTIRHADPDLTESDPSSGKWNLYLNINGYLKLLNDWVPALGSVRDGQKLTINRTVPINVPAGRGLSLLVHGRECDIPSGKVVFGEYSPVVKPCPLNTDEPTIKLLNDDPGLILDAYRTAGAALGHHVSTSASSTTRFPGSGRISFGDGTQGAGDYELSYTVKRR